jgi:hypothetical protein
LIGYGRRLVLRLVCRLIAEFHGLQDDRPTERRAQGLDCSSQPFQLSSGGLDGWVRYVMVHRRFSRVGCQNIESQVGTRIFEEVLLAPARQHQRTYPCR